MTSTDVIKQGQNVILKKGKSLRLHQVWRKRKVHLDKKHFYLDEAIGKPYGTTWEVFGNSLQLIRPEGEGDEDAKAGGTDNRSLHDDRHSQKLSEGDIRELRNQGNTGEVIVEQLVENSKSFKDKTVYSQAKYLKRKREKYLMRFQILKPNTLLLCEMYGTRAPSKNIHLRIDTLSQILTAANIQSGINVMMMETCQGLLLGAIMERMAGRGTIVQMHSENAPVRLAVDAYNFPDSYKDTLYSFPLDQFHLLDARESQETDDEIKNVSDVENSASALAPCSQTSQEQTPVDVVHLQTNSEHSRLSGEESSETKAELTERLSGGNEDSNVAECEVMEDQCGDAQDVTATSGPEGLKRKFPENPEKLARKQRRREKLNRVGNLLQSTKMDTLVLACRFQPLPIFTALFKYLAPSRPFVVFCHYIEPLMECNEWLRNSGDAVNIRVTETWFREYQVLPERTHPQVNMSGTGGYILTGVTVSNEI